MKKAYIKPSAIVIKSDIQAVLDNFSLQHKGVAGNDIVWGAKESSFSDWDDEDDFYDDDTAYGGVSF